MKIFKLKLPNLVARIGIESITMSIVKYMRNNHVYNLNFPNYEAITDMVYYQVKKPDEKDLNSTNSCYYCFISKTDTILRHKIGIRYLFMEVISTVKYTVDIVF